jgi:hypothetical protein
MALAERLLPETAQAAAITLALALGAASAVLAVVFRRVLIGVVGFLGGGAAFLLLLRALSPEFIAEAWIAVAIFVAGGVLGVLLFSRLFELGLALVTSVIGAITLLDGLSGVLRFSSTAGNIALVVLIGLGLVVQLGLFRRR